MAMMSSVAVRVYEAGETQVGFGPGFHGLSIFGGFLLAHVIPGDPVIIEASCFL